MADQDWGDLETLPQERRGLSKWWTFCGCGCLAMALVLAAFAWWAYSFAEDGVDADLQWQRLGEAIELEARPAGFELEFGMTIPFVGVDLFIFSPTSEQPGAMIFVPPDTSNGREFRRDLWEDTRSDRAVDELELEVQGRVLPALRGSGQASNGRGFTWGDNEDGPFVIVDIGPEGGEIGPLLMLFTGEERPEAVDEAAVRSFLAPFHIGPDWDPSAVPVYDPNAPRRPEVEIIDRLEVPPEIDEPPAEPGSENPK